MSREIPLSHPGEILLEEWLKPLEISQYALAKAISVPPRRINEIIKGKRAITPDTALRLAAYFGTDAQSWLNLQTHYDIEQTKAVINDDLNHISSYRYA
ncbi:HigA family addiction module antitoxin [Pasteurella caecimuris]|uniref:HigA family addiction module antitoxin n=1 Tax=Rodentibacter caecimuris TaxID=1796644 RepID=UPI00214FFACD|nr:MULTISPECIES: HigA family addiction module antitoxin [Pasteurellaceae]MCR1838611.1 HigA family addiction module antitoxin [Pasteurella caecimuris]MCU0107908.1 HigA family addiction module antitoxin [Pasteurella caecimuris]MCX2960290.1 HigA family addiction module antitoxin [Rodentibacter heylii]